MDLHLNTDTLLCFASLPPFDKIGVSLIPMGAHHFLHLEGMMRKMMIPMCAKLCSRTHGGMFRLHFSYVETWHMCCTVVGY